MELFVFIYETDKEREKRLCDRLELLTAAADISRVKLYNCRSEKAAEFFSDEQWQSLQMAFISLDSPDGKNIGKTLYQKNPACRLTYYKEGCAQLEELLPSRPVRYWNCLDFRKLDIIFKKQLKEMEDDPFFFHYSDRLRSVSIPYQSVYYAYSRNRAVYLHTVQGEVGPLPRTLDYIQKLFKGEAFVRVHQSFLVRRRSVRMLDKGKKVIIMENGEEIPVSKSLYNKVVNLFDKNDSLEGQKCGIQDKTGEKMISCGQEVRGNE